MFIDVPVDGAHSKLLEGTSRCRSVAIQPNEGSISLMYFAADTSTSCLFFTSCSLVDRLYIHSRVLKFLCSLFSVSHCSRSNSRSRTPRSFSQNKSSSLIICHSWSGTSSPKHTISSNLRSHLALFCLSRNHLQIYCKSCMFSCLLPSTFHRHGLEQESSLFVMRGASCTQAIELTLLMYFCYHEGCSPFFRQVFGRLWRYDNLKQPYNLYHVYGFACSILSSYLLRCLICAGAVLRLHRSFNSCCLFTASLR